MTEPISPGVYIQEPEPPHVIQGVSTSIAGFVGPTHCGPLVLPDEPVGYLGEFERIYGGPEPLQFEHCPPTPNYLWHAARAFFENGGTQLYVSRVHCHGAKEHSDGRRPSVADYAGGHDPATKHKTGLAAFEAVNEISVVAAPGATSGKQENAANAAAIQQLLIAHAEKMRYRIAVLDSTDGQSPDAVLTFRANFSSSNAALYYPWVTVDDPSTGAKLSLPPSGFVAGIYARSDAAHGVFKAPANEVIELAVGLETILNDAQQKELNPAGVNALRFFPQRGYRVWGARTVSSDSDWKYVNVRRYFLYLEHSLNEGLKWVNFEPNGEPLWAKIRRSVTEFFMREWRSGALMGNKPEQAFFVKCDRTTMTQDDIDNGRVIIEIGFAPIKPAEFVIIRIDELMAKIPG